MQNSGTTRALDRVVVVAALQREILRCEKTNTLARTLHATERAVERKTLSVKGKKTGFFNAGKPNTITYGIRSLPAMSSDFSRLSAVTRLPASFPAGFCQSARRWEGRGVTSLSPQPRMIYCVVGRSILAGWCSVVNGMQ